MKVLSLIEKADALFPNVYPFPQKADWLFSFDKRLYEELLSRYENPPAFSSDEGSSPERELLLGEAEGELYVNYLMMLMELYSGNIPGYQNAAAIFNSGYLSFMNHFNRTHLIKSVHINVK